VKKIPVKLTTIACVLIAIALPSLGYADVLGNIAAPTVGLKKLMVVISYMFGVGFVVAGIMKYPKYRKNPSETPLSSPISLLLLGIALLLLPWVASHSMGSAIKEGDVGGTYQFIGE